MYRTYQNKPALTTSGDERRRFLRWIGAVGLLTACQEQATDVLSPTFGLSVSNSGARLNVRDFGAAGDGVHDDTASFDRALRALTQAGGGTLGIPAGVYLIDPLKSLRPTDNTSLVFDRDAILKAKPVNITSYAIILISNARNIAVFGGTLIGERNEHKGTTGEWGMGVRIVGSSSVRLDGIKAQDCWGDGFYIGASAERGESRDITVSNCIAANNRRQGISITGCVGAVIEGTELTGTNGTAPESGIDLEPNPGLRVSNVLLRNCVMLRNSGCGILMVGDQVTDVRVEGCRVADNRREAAALIRGVSGCRLQANTFENSRQSGVLLEDAHSNEVIHNVLRNNRKADPAKFANILVSRGSTGNLIAGNSFGRPKSLLYRESRDVVIDPSCHDNEVDDWFSANLGRAPTI